MSQSPQGDIQERIAAARREAESLKEKIRAKRESSADTSRECYPPLLSGPITDICDASQCAQWQTKCLLFPV